MTEGGSIQVFLREILTKVVNSMRKLDLKVFDLIFTDGACKGNPGPGGWGAVALLEGSRVVELGGETSETTNNRMEMRAVVEALRVAAREKVGERELAIISDSQYVLQGIQEWIPGWRRRGWKTSSGSEVQNKDLWLEMVDCLEKAKNCYKQVAWFHVLGHTGCPGNERVDRIASSFALGSEPNLYDGAYDSYGMDLNVLPMNSAHPGKKKYKSKQKAHSYVSYVDGTFLVHATWKDCEARVRGRSGAKCENTLTLQSKTL